MQSSWISLSSAELRGGHCKRQSPVSLASISGRRDHPTSATSNNDNTNITDITDNAVSARLKRHGRHDDDDRVPRPCTRIRVHVTTGRQRTRLPQEHVHVGRDVTSSQERQPSPDRPQDPPVGRLPLSPAAPRQHRRDAGHLSDARKMTRGPSGWSRGRHSHNFHHLHRLHWLTLRLPVHGRIWYKRFLKILSWLSFLVVRPSWPTDKCVTVGCVRHVSICHTEWHVADEGLAKAASQLEPVAKSNLEITVTEVSLNQRSGGSAEVKRWEALYLATLTHSDGFQGARDLTTGGLHGEMYLWSAVWLSTGQQL